MDYQRLKKVLPKQSKKWDCNDIYIWLSFIGLKSIFSQFRHHKIDGSCLSKITQSDMIQQLGIKSKIIKRKLEKWIHQGLSKYDHFLESSFFQQEISESSSQNFFHRSFKKITKIQSQEQQEIIDYGQTQVNEANIDQQSTMLLQTCNVRKKKPQENLQFMELIIQPIDSLTSACYSFKEVGGNIGRFSGNQILVIEDYLSQIHANIEYERPYYYLNDCSLQRDKSNKIRTGTWKKILGKMELHSQMLIQMGQNNFIFNISSDNQKLQINQCHASFYQIPNVVDVIYSYNGFEKQKIFIGRKSSNDISFPADSTMSNTHAKITYLKNKWYIEDIATTNGTWLLMTKKERIYDGMIFRLGISTLSYECKLVGSNSNDLKKTKLPDEKCSKCRKNKREIVFMPCCHLLFCLCCSNKVTICPVCFAKINQNLRIFVA